MASSGGGGSRAETKIDHHDRRAEEGVDDARPPADILSASGGGNSREGALDESDKWRNVMKKEDRQRLGTLLTNKKALLETRYGGGPGGGIDADKLFRDTSPLLPAAFVGDVSIVDAVLRALQPPTLEEMGSRAEPVNRTSLNSHLQEKDGMGRTVLHLAAFGGSTETFVAIASACGQGEHRGPYRGAFRWLEADAGVWCINGPASRSAPFARRGRRTGDSRHDPLVNGEAEQWQRRRRLEEALANGKLYSFLSTHRSHEDAPKAGGLTEEEMHQMLTAKDTVTGSTVLMAAALGGSAQVFEFALHLTERALNGDPNKVRQQLADTDSAGRSLLHLAAASRKKSAVDAVMDACHRQRKLNTDQMLKMLSGDDPTGTASDQEAPAAPRDAVTFLMAAASSGSGRTFEAALEATKEVLKESKERDVSKKVREMLMKKDPDGRSLLHLAAASGSRSAMSAVSDACWEHGVDANHMLGMLTSQETTKTTTLMAAARSGRGEAFETAMDIMRDALRSVKAKDIDTNKSRTCTELVGNYLMGDLSKADLKETYMKKALLKMDEKRQTVLELAFTSSNKTVVDAVWKSSKELGVTAAQLKRGSSLKELPKTDIQDRVFFDLAGASRGKNAVDVVRKHCTELDLIIPEVGGWRVSQDEESELCKDKQDCGADKKLMRDMITSTDITGDTLLSKAVDTGKVEVFNAVQKFAWELLEDPDQRASLVASKNIFGESLLERAFDSRGVEDLPNLEGAQRSAEELKRLSNLFEAVLTCAWDALPHDQVSSAWQLHEFIESRDVNGAMSTVEAKKAGTLAPLLLRKAFGTGDLGLFEAAVNYVVGRGVGGKICQDEPFLKEVRTFVEEMINESDSLFAEALGELLDCDRFRNEFYNPSLDTKVATLQTSKMDDVFLHCVERHTARPERGDNFNTLSSLMANSARPSVAALRRLSLQDQSGNHFKKCCLRAVTSARNPFIPGITLSIRLGEAAEMAAEGERKTIKDIQSSINRLLLEILERLPQTVSGFEDVAGKGACAQMLQPRLKGLDAADRSVGLKGGPLEMILAEPRQLEMFGTGSLVMNFLSREFRLGLPGVKVDIGSVLPGVRGQQAAQEVYEGWNDTAYMEDNGLVLSSILHDWWYKACVDGGVDTVYFFPAADFILSSMIGAPTEYYRVPAMRMALDFVVYLGMVVALSFFVLFHSTAGTLGSDGIISRDFSSAECVCALIFVTAGVYREMREISRGFGRYLADKWNVLDALGLLCLSVGLIIRWDDWSSEWGPAFYALSAPLVVSRVLFFAQILPFQGPMIEVIFRMTSKILQFGAVMSIIMIGFAMALHVLFRDLDTFGQTFLGLFKAMLGDTELFDEFSGGRYDGVATFLLVVYLFIVSIMLLNLLIAILSTAHSQVEENVARESKTSRARLFDHYRTVVQKDLLPAPFNLVNLALAVVMCILFPPICLFVADPTDLWARTRKWKQHLVRRIGLVLFWGLLTPFAFAGEMVLNSLGCPYALCWCYKKEEERRQRGVERNKGRDDPEPWAWVMCKWMLQLVIKLGFIVLMWCLYPVVSIWDWINGTIVVFLRLFFYLDERTGGDEEGTRAVSNKVIVERILTKGPGGVSADKLRGRVKSSSGDGAIRDVEKK